MKSLFYYIPAFIVLLLAAGILVAAKAFAFETPSFPTCINPNGLVIASYDTGIHGIAGDYTMHTGKDTVYAVSDSTFIQCFCDEQQNGTQTNWWKIDNLYEEELAYFQADGWIYEPNGEDWGLDQGPYLAKNTSYNCDDCVTPTPPIDVTPTEAATPSATPTIELSLTPTPEAGQSGTIQSSSASSTPGLVQASTATSGKILAAATLAPTGNSAEMALTAIGALLSLGGSLLLKKTLE